MLRFTYRLDRLLQLRRSGRDLIRGESAALIRRKDAAQATLRTLELERAADIAALRRLSGADVLDVERIASRRGHADLLASDMIELSRDVAQLAARIEESGRALMQSEQAVRSLEKLAERQRAEHVHRQSRCDSRELEECRGSADTLR